MTKGNIYLSLFFLLILASCKYFKPRRNAVARDTSISTKTSFNNLFLDSSRVDDFLKNYPAYEAFQEEFRDFYSQRNYQHAWFDSSGLAEHASNFITLRNIYIADFQDSSLFNHELNHLLEQYQEKKPGQHFMPDSIIKTELLLTGQFFLYASKIYKGDDLDLAQMGWFIPRKKISLTALLDSVILSKGKEQEIFAPLNPQYKNLQEQLQIYSAIEKNGRLDSLKNITIPFKKGDSAIELGLIKNRLQLLGDLKNNDSSGGYDSTLFSAVKGFQKRMGLSEDGVIGQKMINELNTPLPERIKCILVNMERARWMPAEKDGNYILVNIPEYKMHVFDSGRTIFSMNVIVGTSANNTVIFSGNLKYVVFSPYWNIPESIVRKEIMPQLQKNTQYLAKNNMEITGYNGKIPTIRQKPGPKNSLGLVKFLFPNNYNIYFHDTPNRDLFSLSNRSFSHGCIRLGEPKKFAAYLLREDNSWNSKNIDEAMHLEKEKWVTIKKAVPVMITYFTSWVDKDGRLNFRKDIYGHDSRMSEKLFSK
ncbi:MAG: hypothetical protein RLZZ28_1120 [Bacteroidota bacterium]